MMDAMAILADPTRRAILQMVWGRELAAGRIAACFDVTAGAISQHLAKLREAGLVRMRRAGRNWFYEADLEALGPLAPALEAMWRSKLDELRALAESEQRKIDKEGAA
ncbi:MAG: metalloregulator ArsR/SmtB family transcription factor [Phycisphaerales bacterium]